MVEFVLVHYTINGGDTVKDMKRQYLMLSRQAANKVKVTCLCPLEIMVIVGWYDSKKGSQSNVDGRGPRPTSKGKQVGVSRVKRLVRGRVLRFHARR